MLLCLVSVIMLLFKTVLLISLGIAVFMVTMLGVSYGINN